ncbi:hypothetical protein KAW38_04775 [Candidatus Micrarchaeota archaeon]|nr:hypothetical protein [Candidatus Micrarchaeota archaeon]
MQTIEAVISLLVLLSFSIPFLISAPLQDTSLYQLQIAGDIWRVLYLKGDLYPLDKYEMQKDADKIKLLTGLDVCFDEMDVCTGLVDDGLVVKKTILTDLGFQRVTMRIGVEE